MTNDLGQFHEEFFQDILIGAEADGQFAEDTFFDRFSAELVDAGEIETADRVHFQHQRGLRVDGYGGSPVTANGVLSLLLVDYSPTAEVETLTKTDMDAIFKRGANFVEKCRDPAFRNGLEESSPVFGLADMVASEMARRDFGKTLRNSWHSHAAAAVGMATMLAGVTGWRANHFAASAGFTSSRSCL